MDDRLGTARARIGEAALGVLAEAALLAVILTAVRGRARRPLVLGAALLVAAGLALPAVRVGMSDHLAQQFGMTRAIGFSLVELLPLDSFGWAMLLAGAGALRAAGCAFLAIGLVRLARAR